MSDYMKKVIVSPDTATLVASRSFSQSLRHYSAVYAAFFNYSFIREMNFKANFVLWLFVESIWFALQLGFNEVLYLHTDTIGTWNKWEVVLLIGTSHFVQQLFQA